jgi:hypothetical protein
LFNRLFERCECRCNKHLPCCSKKNVVLSNVGLVGNVFKGVNSTADCCRRCTWHPGCGGWELSSHGVCILRLGTPSFVPNPMANQLTTWAGARAGKACSDSQPAAAQKLLVEHAALTAQDV